jgi:uncharacterized repeat protein (TIGR03803 family)
MRLEKHEGKSLSHRLTDAHLSKTRERCGSLICLCASRNNQRWASPRIVPATEVCHETPEFNANITSVQRHGDANALVKPAIALAMFLVLAATSLAQTTNLVYSFKSGYSAGPLYVTPAQGRDGRLYGTTTGEFGTNGSIFRVTTSGSPSPAIALSGNNGSTPGDGLILATDGYYYGTASAGGSLGLGVLLRMSPNGLVTVLHNFAGGSDGAVPYASVIQGSDGNIYGTTFGNSSTASTVFRYTTAGSFSTIFQFNATQGQSVTAPLIQGTDGDLYGTASQGGANSCGSIFKLTTSGSLLLNYSFPCGAGGSAPIGPPMQASNGSFYGTTSQGGTYGVGSVFKLSVNGTPSILYSFQGYFNGGADASTPYAGLLEATDGNLYGVTTNGGTQNDGTLFRITTSGSYKLLLSFNGTTGNLPLAAPMQHTNGLLYGAADGGGKFRFGTVYSLNLGLGAFVALVRYTGKAGSTAQILGQGFTGATSVTFNGVAATTFKVVTDTYMTAVVPSGATTGAVVVTTPSGQLKSNKSFRITGGTTTAATAKSAQPVPRVTKKAN